MYNQRATVAEINLANLRFNIRQIKSLLKPGVKLMPVIKANAYGHGAPRIGLELEKMGVDWLAVACIYEVVKIREAGVKLPILNLGPIFPDEAQAVFDLDFSPTVFSLPVVKKLSDLGVVNGKTVNIHIKVDSGMNRIGLQPDEVLGFVKKVRKLAKINIQGIYTHFANSDEPEREATLIQINNFERALNSLKKERIKIPLVHAANSGATLWWPQTHYNLVRVGTLPFGFNPTGLESMKMPIKLNPLLTLKTRITHIKTIPVKTPISYGWTWVAKRESVIASLPVGYADGFRRAPKNWGEVLIKGKRVPIVGRVCMDQTMIDVTDIKGVKTGDEVVLIGKQGNDEIGLWEVADKLETNAHEVVSALAERVTRIYKD